MSEAGSKDRVVFGVRDIPHGAAECPFVGGAVLLAKAAFAESLRFGRHAGEDVGTRRARDGRKMGSTAMRYLIEDGPKQ